MVLLARSNAGGLLSFSLVFGTSFNSFCRDTGLGNRKSPTARSCNGYPFPYAAVPRLRPRGAAELLHPDARERARLTLAQQGDELEKGNGQASSPGRAARKWRANAFFRRASAVESHVGTLDFRLFPRREPVTPAAEKHVLQLGVGLGMVDARAVDGMLHEHTDEPAASRRVGKQLARVGGADEGGDARQGLAMPWYALRRLRAESCMRFSGAGVSSRVCGRTRRGSAAPSR